MTNSFFGKIIANVRKRLNHDLIEKSDTHRLLNWQSEYSFDENNAKHETFNLYSFNKESNKLMRPVYVGFCILGLSKLMKYEW